MPEMSKVQCALLMLYVRPWRGTRGRPATLSLLTWDRSSLLPLTHAYIIRERARDPADQTTGPACIETLPHYLFYVTLYVRYTYAPTVPEYLLTTVRSRLSKYCRCRFGATILIDGKVVVVVL